MPRPLSLAAALGVALVGGCRCDESPSSSAAAACREQTGGRLELAGVRVWVGSSATTDRVAAGRVAECGSGAEALRVFRAVGSAHADIPEALRPGRVEVHLGPKLDGRPPLQGVEFHAPSRALLVERESKLELDHSVWLHELAHVRLAGARPEGPLARRVWATIEEGVADYFAAAVSGSPRLGRGRRGQPVRDLSDPPGASARDWALLALPSVRADPHRLGWRLAAELWRREPRPGPLLEDVATALSGREALEGSRDIPSEAIAAFVARCPARSRATVTDVVTAWAPREILSVKPDAGGGADGGDRNVNGRVSAEGGVF